VSKYFHWQKNNTIGLFNPKDEKSKLSFFNQSNFISFENLEFVKRFAYKESLDYAFFLKQGRPFFAFYYLMRNQIKKYGKINKTLVEEARLRTNLILIENFGNTIISSSCITFSELINADTFKLKLNVCLMKILCAHFEKQGMTSEMANERTKTYFIRFFKDELEAKNMVGLFEHVLLNKMLVSLDSKNMFTMHACSIWNPLMCFCKIYNLNYSVKYMQVCAESNQWLMYLLFAQIYQIPRFQVIACLDFFTDIGLKQHLEYALHNVITSSSSIGDISSNPASYSSSNISTKLRKAFRKTENKFTDWFKSKNSKKKSTRLSKSQSKAKDEPNSSDENEDYNFEILEHNDAQRHHKDHLESIDFYELLITCQNSPEPVMQLQHEAIRWKTPVLSVFATFYQQHDKISCLCTFLYASMRGVDVSLYKLKKVEINTKTNPKNILFDLSDLKEAIIAAASKSYLRTLLNALKIFTPKTILDIYVEFLYNLFVIKDSNQAQKLYSSYKHELIKLTLSKHQSHIPIEWYEEVINKLTRIMILKCYMIEDLQNLTNILGQVNEYRRLIKLVFTLKSNKITVNCEEWIEVEEKSDQFNDICFKVIEELLKIQKFNEAEDLADYCELNRDRIHLARIGRQIELLRLNNDFEEILEFWKSAHVQLMKIGIKDVDFIDFLKV